GKDQIEFGYKNYAEASYGDSPGATPTTLFRLGYVRELTPLYDPELNRIFVLRDEAGADRDAPRILSRRENVGLRIQWLQGELGQYWQDKMLEGENFFAEAMIKRGSDEVYLYWTGLKADVLGVRCSIGEPVVWEAEMVGKLYDSKTSTIHSYGASPGEPWEWDDTYLQVSPNDSGWTTIPDVTDWEFRIDNRLKPNFVFNASGSKQLTTLEEMERVLTARLTMNLSDNTYLDYLMDGDELYLKLMLPNSQWVKFNKGKFSTVEPVLKPEDLIACRVQFEGRYLTTSWD
ncbi:hypothetical protein ISS40_11865, partial [Candidatus Bathyarchaeota archaeon]|nr:hypothetical protein [Candidatus Bathyarchaeota archaeon]